MEYIHDMRPSSGLLPASVEDRAKVRMVTEMVASGIQPYQVRKTETKHLTPSISRILPKQYQMTRNISRTLPATSRIRLSAKLGPKDGSLKVSEL